MTILRETKKEGFNMRIAIVDDLASDREELRRRLETLLACRQLHAKIFEYGDGNSFLSDAEKENFTLVFLDIYMAEENGVETAKKLRAFDSECMLVFTTASTDHALDGFRVRAMQYLVKPYADQDLADLFDEILARLPAPDQYIALRVSGDTVRLRLSDIMYAEHFRHQIHILTPDETTVIARLTFGEFVNNLPDERFFACSRGTLINLEYAQDFDGSAFWLTNGKEVPVSRNLVKSARSAFGDFLFKRGKKL